MLNNVNKCREKQTLDFCMLLHAIYIKQSKTELF